MLQKSFSRDAYLGFAGNVGSTGNFDAVNAQWLNLGHFGFSNKLFFWVYGSISNRGDEFRAKLLGETFSEGPFPGAMK